VSGIDNMSEGSNRSIGAWAMLIFLIFIGALFLTDSSEKMVECSSKRLAWAVIQENAKSGELSKVLNVHESAGGQDYLPIKWPDFNAVEYSYLGNCRHYFRVKLDKDRLYLDTMVRGHRVDGQVMIIERAAHWQRPAIENLDTTSE